MTTDREPQDAEYTEQLPEKRREIAEPPQGLPVITEGDLVHAQEYVKRLVQVKKIILGATNDQDWVTLGKKPYLTESGCKKIAQVMGVNFTGLQVKEERQEIEGDLVFRYTATVTAQWNLNGRTRSVDELGEADSNDPFFREYTDHATGDKRRRPLSEVRLGNVKKKAVTNAMNRALKNILALNGTSWEDIKGAGVKEEKTSSVQYGKSKERRDDRTGDAGGDPKTRLKNVIADLALWDEVSFDDILQGLSAFVGRDGKEVACKDFSKLGGQWLEKTLAKAEKAWREHPANAPREPGAEAPEAQA